MVVAVRIMLDQRQAHDTDLANDIIFHNLGFLFEYLVSVDEDGSSEEDDREQAGAHGDTISSEHAQDKSTRAESR